MFFLELDTLLFVRKICSYEITWERKNHRFRMVWYWTLPCFPWNGFIQVCKHGEIKNVISWYFWKSQTEACQEKTAQISQYLTSAGFLYLYIKGMTNRSLSSPHTILTHANYSLYVTVYVLLSSVPVYSLIEVTYPSESYSYS